MNRVYCNAGQPGEGQAERKQSDQPGYLTRNLKQNYILHLYKLNWTVAACKAVDSTVGGNFDREACSTESRYSQLIRKSLRAPTGLSAHQFTRQVSDDLDAPLRRTGSGRLDGDGS